jgi:hypothetical protein
MTLREKLYLLEQRLKEAGRGGRGGPEAADADEDMGGDGRSGGEETSDRASTQEEEGDEEEAAAAQGPAPAPRCGVVEAAEARQASPGLPQAQERAAEAVPPAIDTAGA